MSYLENITTTEETAGFSLKTLNIPQLANLFIPVGLVGKIKIWEVGEGEKVGGSVKIPIPVLKDDETIILGGIIPDAIFDYFQQAVK